MKHNIQQKYPAINYYFSDRSQPIPVFIKLTTCIMFLKKKLDHDVIVNKFYYSNLEKLETQVFCNIETEDLQDLLDMFVKVMCEYLCNADILENNTEKINTHRDCVNAMEY